MYQRGSRGAGDETRVSSRACAWELDGAWCNLVKVELIEFAGLGLYGHGLDSVVCEGYRAKKSS